MDKISSETVPFIILVPASQLEKLEKEKLSDHLRSQFFIDYGIKLPDLLLRASNTLAENRVMILINEIRADEFVLHFDRLCVVNSTDELMQLGIETVIDEGRIWIEPQDKATLANLGYQLRSAVDELYQNMAVLLSRHVMSCHVMSCHVNEYVG